MELSIAIVSYNTRDLLLACLASIRQTSTDVCYELIVVDNASKDGSAEAVRMSVLEAQVIANRDNEGYAKACNQAAAVAAGRYLLFLNSDTVMKAGTLRKMVDCLDREPTIGIVGCLQRNEAGQILRSCFPFPSLRDHLRHAAWIPRSMRRTAGVARDLDWTRSQDVDWANGAGLMVRRELFEQAGGFDERFFMYFEDVDLCRRIHRRGYRVRHLAEAEIVHLVGGSSGGDRARLNVEWEFSRIRYVEKHFPPLTLWIMKLWIACGAGWRLVRRDRHRDVIAAGGAVQLYLSVCRRLWRGACAEPSRATLGAGSKV